MTTPTEPTPATPGPTPLADAAAAVGLPGVAELADRVERISPAGRRTLVGIAGAPGSGKTTLALALVAALRARHGEDAVAHLPMDGFHLGDTQLARLRRLARKGAPDTFDADGYAHALHRARTSERDVYVPGFERDLEQPIAADLVVTATARYVVTEGNYLLADGWQDARAELDEAWFVTVDTDLRRERLVARHVRFGKAPQVAAAWVRDVDEPNAALVDATAAGADLVVVATAHGWATAALA